MDQQSNKAAEQQVHIPVQEVYVQIGAIEFIVFQQHISNVGDLFDFASLLDILRVAIGLEVAKHYYCASKNDTECLLMCLNVCLCS